MSNYLQLEITEDVFIEIDNAVEEDTSKDTVVNFHK